MVEVETDSVVEGAIVVTTGSVTFVLLDEALAMPATTITSATGTAIFAHNGHDRTHATGNVASRLSTVGICCVGDAGTTLQL
jgi:hypothetical protein